jgi:hypothetical protein
MDLLKRLLGGGAPHDQRSPAGRDASDAAESPEDAERAHELDMLKGEDERLTELQQRQLRYQRYAWQPPAQGGERRADDDRAAE